MMMMQKKKSRGGNNINNVRKLQQQSRRKQQQQQKQQHEQNQQRKQQQITTTTKKKKIKHRHFLLMIFFVLSCFVLLPILFLQHQLQIDHHSNHHNSPVNEHLMQEFYTKKQQRQKHLLKSSSKSSSTSRTIKNNDDPPSNLILTTYSEPIDTIIIEQQQTSSPSNKPSFIRNTSSSILKRREYPRVKNCLSIMEDFPIDDYPMDDPYLPWIHDYFISHTGTAIKFVAQNKRRCGPTTTTNDDDSKKDDNMATFLKKWDRQYALFQSIPIVVEEGDNNNNNKNNTTKTKTRYRFATSREEATYPSTRFQCRFHSPTSGTTTTNITTFSEYPFDYEFVHWRKQKKSMLDTSKEPSKDMPSFWLSQLLFSCPIPIQYQNLIKIINNNSNNRDDDDDDDDDGEKSKYDSSPIFYLDLVPIRTPVRSNLFLNESQTGPGIILSTPLFDPQTEFGYQHYLPPIQNSGRWANLPICSTNHRSTGNDNNNKNNAVDSVVVDEKDSSQQQEQSNVKKEYRLVGCTWTAASYTRRGDAVRVSDSAKRLEEWIRFHLMVGVQHLYVYDNSPPTANNNGNNDDKISTTELKKVTDKFPPTQVTYHRWTCQICNNNRPAHKNPGERSSQYAAEASCRERYGPLTEWMTFVDTDELLIPMKANEKGEYKWDTILDEMDAKQINIMKFLSSRGKPRIDLMEELVDQSQCIDADPNSKKKMKNGPPQPCKGPRSNETFLKVYNCDYIRPRKPNRFARAMKQIYKPSHVLSHFVHYSTVTADAAITYEEFMNNKKSSSATSSTIQQQQFVPFVRDKKWEKQSPELFLDELTQGALIHARSILPHETMNVNETCYVGSKLPCNVGFLCDDTVQFVNSIHKDNVFQNPTTGSYCNCWRNPVVDNVLVPLLEKQFH